MEQSCRDCVSHWKRFPAPSFRSTFLQTDSVPVNDLNRVHVLLIPPKSVIAKNTTDAMDSGMIYGTASMIDGMIDRIQEEMGRELAVVATGGLAKNVVPYCKHKITHDPNLLLKGLRVLYYKNMK